MAMTQLALLFIGGLATLATLGLFYRFPDRWTGVVVTFLAAILWGMFGLSAFDVIVTEHVNPPVSEPITPLAYLGLGMAFIVGIYGFYDVLSSTGEEVKQSDVDMMP